MLKKYIIWFILLPVFVWAQDYPDKPENYITDNASVLNSEQISQLNRKLRNFEDSTSNQLFVYIALSLNDRDIETLSQEIFHKWKIGQQNKNNGILLTVFINDHKFRIQTGYGMEGALPDLLTKRIQDEFMRPRFKESKYYEGINAGIDELIYFSINGSLSTAETEPQQEEGWVTWLLAYVFNALLLILFLYLNKKSTKSAIKKTILTVISVILFFIPCVGSFFLFFMCVIISNKAKWNWRSGTTYSGSDSVGSDSSWSSSDSSSDSGFDGGGGGDSGGGGSSSDW